MLQPLEVVCAPYRRIGMAGMAKNAGKTTALNYLIERFSEAGEVLGISSVGRDGEATDELTNLPKPRIHPPPGALVATAYESALASEATLVKVADTAFRTALGPVVIYRVKASGYVEVAGPVKAREAAELTEHLMALGCFRVLLDGAADRRAFLSAHLDGFVLSTGLAVSGDLSRVIEETKGVLDALQLSEPKPEWRVLCKGSQPGALTPRELVPWPHESFLNGLAGLASWWPRGCVALFVPGAFTDSLADALLRAHQAPAIIVSSGTHLLAGRDRLEKLAHRGSRFYALRPLNALALTLNPTGPQGEKIDAQEFLRGFRDAFPHLPVVDVTQPSL
jgi:hypothetical protein